MIQRMDFVVMARGQLVRPVAEVEIDMETMTVSGKVVGFVEELGPDVHWRRIGFMEDLAALTRPVTEFMPWARVGYGTAAQGVEPATNKAGGAV